MSIYIYINVHEHMFIHRFTGTNSYSALFEDYIFMCLEELIKCFIRKKQENIKSILKRKKFYLMTLSYWRKGR